MKIELHTLKKLKCFIVIAAVNGISQVFGNVMCHCQRPLDFVLDPLFLSAYPSKHHPIFWQGVTDGK